MAHVDPYRSAYSLQQLYQYQQQHVQQQQQQPHSSYQTHLASHGSSSMMPYDDLSSSYDSRYSGQSNQFPMYPLSPQNSNQALTAAYHHQQQLHQARRDSSIDLAGVVGRPNSRQSMTLLTPQPMRAGSGSKTTSSSTASRRLQSEEEEEEENAEILQKVSQSGTRSGMTLASSQSTGKNSKKFKRGTNEPKSDIDDDDDEEEGQEKGANRQRDGKRCWCCSRRLCVYMSFLFLLVLAVAMFFVLPRSPGISFVAVVTDGDPVFSRGRIQESFTLQMRVDSSENYLPIKLSSVEMTVWWKMDMTKIGTNEGLPSSVTIHPKVVQTISMPMAFDYQSLRIDTSTDGVLQALIKACTPLPPGSTTPPDQLNLTFGGKMKVWGLSWAWKPEFSFNVGTACPSNAKEQETVPVALPPPPPTTPTGATSSTGTGSSPATPSGTRGTTPSGGNSVATPTPSARS
ncbi:hypothetical protein BGZ74_002801 [Mortierella antarctica]|nr:hypothetical protein BGZ74_002801 [Mortierella antarctica]